MASLSAAHYEGILPIGENGIRTVNLPFREQLPYHLSQHNCPV